MDPGRPPLATVERRADKAPRPAGARRLARASVANAFAAIAGVAIAGVAVAGVAIAASVAAVPAHAAGFADAVWRVPTVALAPLAWRPMRTGAITATPDGRTLLVPTADGLWALAPETGHKLWQLRTGDPVLGAPVLRGAEVLVADGGGDVHAVAAADGRPRWEAPLLLDVAVRAPLVSDGTRVFAVAEPGSLYAIDPQARRVLWRRSVSVDREFLAEGHGSPTVVGTQVIAGLGDGSLVVVDGRDGGLVWQRQLAGEGDGQPDVDTTPVVVGRGAGAVVIAASHRGGLFALSLADGEQRWRLAVEGMRTPLAQGEELFVIDGAGSLWALRHRDGAVRARQPLHGEPSGALAWSAAGLVVPAADGLWLIDPVTLLPLARQVDPYGFAAAPLIEGEAMWAIANDGTVWALRRRRPPL